MEPPRGFAWDPEKHRQNRLKHKVDFFDVLGIFDNPMIYCDDLPDDGQEVRERVLGFANFQVYFVVFTRRGPDIRLISARKAVQREAEIYYNAHFGDPHS